MPKKTSKRNLSGTELTTLTAEKVFGWKNVHKHEDDLISKKQDKLGRWRTAKVPDYANDPVQAYAIDERMKQLGRSARIPEGACPNHEGEGSPQRVGHS
jgi:hypothetical protein